MPRPQHRGREFLAGGLHGRRRPPRRSAPAPDLRRRGVCSQSAPQARGDALPKATARNSFAFLLVDGLFGHEEPLAHALQEGLGEISLVGGSAGDGLSFDSTFIYCDGRFSSDSAVLVLVTTPLPFTEFKTQHFVPTDERLVVTEADPALRVVGRSTACRPPRSTRASWASTPATSIRSTSRHRRSWCSIDGANYVRSIQKVNPDGSLKFYCAIERGVVLRVAKGVDLVANLESALAQVRAQIGPPQLVLAFDCILRKLEIAQAGLESAVSDILRRNNAVGFNTYGEQFCGVHVNQTLTAIALGAARPPARRPQMADREQPAESPDVAGPAGRDRRGSTRSSTRSWTARRSSMNVQGSDFGLFQTTIMLQDQVRLRTEELEAALRDAHGGHGRLASRRRLGDMQTLRRTAALQIQLLELVVQQKDVGELIDRVAAILDMPIVLFDTRGRVVCCSRSAADAPDLAPRTCGGLRRLQGAPDPARRRHRARASAPSSATSL